MLCNFLFSKLEIWSLSVLSKTVRQIYLPSFPIFWSPCAILWLKKILKKSAFIPYCLSGFYLFLWNLSKPISFSDCVLILSTGLSLPWSDLPRRLSRVLMRLSRKAGAVTGGLYDNYPSTPFHLTTVQVSTTDLITDVHSCNRTQQKGRSIGVIIDRSEWEIAERSAQIDSHIIAPQPLCCCVLVINYKTLQDAGTPAYFSLHQLILIISSALAGGADDIFFICVCDVLCYAICLPLKPLTRLSVRRFLVRRKSARPLLQVAAAIQPLPVNDSAVCGCHAARFSDRHSWAPGGHPGAVWGPDHKSYTTHLKSGPP